MRRGAGRAFGPDHVGMASTWKKGRVKGDVTLERPRSSSRAGNPSPRLRPGQDPWPQEWRSMPGQHGTDQGTETRC